MAEAYGFEIYKDAEEIFIRQDRDCIILNCDQVEMVTKWLVEARDEE